ncbi:MAG: transporter substrate-binding domain-containing protein, partial [Oscillospiraceae bacterium]|nr:transporter substrate-binding domain-containing protein [Oscillospiraceae bacterium]
MELRGRLLSLLLLLILIITVLLPSAGCDLSDVNAESGYVRYTSLRDIPGITDTDIFAVADLRAKYDRFIYAMPPSAEAFEDSLTGGINGFSAFFCDALSELFDIPFVLENHSLSDIVDGLDSGEIHFTGTLTPTDERKSQYHMTDPIVIRTLKYFRLDGSRSLSDIQLEGLPKFAFLERSTVFEAVSEALPPDSFEAVFISDTDEVYNLLKNKKIDAFIHENPTESIFESYPDIVATDFLPVIMSPVSFTAQKNEFKPIIDVIQKILLTDDMRFLLDIYNRGSLEYNKHKLNLRLTEAESEYIQDNGKVKVAAEHDNYPISFYNYHDKEFQGIIHDIIPEIEAITGLNFEIVNSHEDDWSGIFRMLENGDVSMITELIRLPDREEFLYADSAILTDYHALISKMEHRDINVNEIPHVNIGLVRDYAHTEVFNLWFPDHKKTRYYDSFEDAFEALSRNEIDMIMASENYLLMITNYREQPGYKINVAFDSSYKSTVGFHPDEDVLKSIVEKSLQIIDVKSHSDKWTKRTFDYRAKLEQARLIWLIAAVVIFMFAVILFNLNRAKNRLKKES